MSDQHEPEQAQPPAVGAQQPRIDLKDVFAFPAPSPDFDPLAESDDRLVLQGFPPRPDREREPELYRVFSIMFSPPLDFILPVLEPSDDEFLTQTRLQTFPEASPKPPDSTAGATTRFETSVNWSGAYIVPDDGDMFVQMFGLWVVPLPLLPPPPDRLPAGQRARYMCSTWIGLDGQRLYENASLPQIGTRQVLRVAANGAQTVKTRAWFQWWVRNFPNSKPVDIKNFSVQPGDIVAGLLRVVSLTQVKLYIRNLSTNKSATPISMTIPDPTLQISGATAEWIMERPAVWGSNPLRLDNFPAYSSTQFAACVASAAVAPGQPETAEILRGADFIRMFEIRYDPERTAFISMPEKRSDVAVRLTYGDFA